MNAKMCWMLAGLSLFVAILGCRFVEAQTEGTPPTPTAIPLPTDSPTPETTSTATLAVTAEPMLPTETLTEGTIFPTLPATLYYPTLPSQTAEPTSLPGVLIRIRNMAEAPVNLYRYGRTGELHYLGWLNHGFYGEFRFPSLGEWLIRYCFRDREGRDLTCRDKMINFTREGQEFRVP